MKLQFVSLILWGISSLGAEAFQGRQNSLGMKLVEIPAGKFFMGSLEDEVTRYSNEAQHQVVLTQGFYIGQTEVTQGQWSKVMKESPQELETKRLKEKEEGLSKKVDSPKPKLMVNYPKATAEELATTKKMRAFSQKSKEKAKQDKKAGKQNRFGPDYPMCFVNWSEAMAFCQALTELEDSKGVLEKNWHYRLPTEAEWEYCARAGTTTPVFSGKQPNFRDEASMVDFKDYAWINPYSNNHIHKVAQLKPNAWGLYDTLGNVAEWCLDIHDDFGTESMTDPLVLEGPGQLRMYRGLTAHNGPRDIRIARRKVGGPRVPYWTFFGFRVVLAPFSEKHSDIPHNHLNR